MTDDALVARRRALRHPRADEPVRGAHPAGRFGRSAVLHRAVRGLQPPGRTWYPALGRTSFAMWGDVTTCYHESVPGHHLQIGYARLQGERLSRFQRGVVRLGAWRGLGAVRRAAVRRARLVREPRPSAGLPVRPAAARGPRDHRHRHAPRSAHPRRHDARAIGTPFHGGEVWTPDLALEFAISETGQGETFLRSEIDRYLGWPAQAISYKIGEREWLAARADRAAPPGRPIRSARVPHRRAVARAGRPGPTARRAEHRDLVSRPMSSRTHVSREELEGKIRRVRSTRC